MTRVSPVTVNVALDRRSLELLPVLSSHRIWLHDQLAGDARIAEQARRHDEADGLRCAGLQLDSSESDQLLRRERDAGRRVGCTWLHDLGSRPLPALVTVTDARASP